VNILVKGFSLVLLGSGLAAVPGLSAQAVQTAPPVAPGRSMVQEIKDVAKGSVSVAKERSTGRIGFARTGANGDLLPAFDGSATAKSDAYLDRFASAFGAPAAQLHRADVTRSNDGSTVTYTQSYKGVPVFGSMLKVNVDRAGDLTSVNGFAVPGLDLSVQPRLSESEAAARAVTAVKADPPSHGEKAASAKGVRAASTDLVVYRTGATAGLPGRNLLVYVVEVTNGANIRDMVFVDANADKLVNRYSMVHDDLDRHVYEQEFTPAAQVWQEGDPFPGTLNEDQQNIVHGSGEAYWFFRNTWGRDSYDGAGASMHTVNNDPRISCPNANWNGTTTNYCNGVTSDDVVAHEWGHAYTEYTHGLIYQYQPGALNESYSDIWGETVDLINNRMDDDEGNLDAKRPDGQCSTHTPAKPLLTVNSPSTIARDCATGGAGFGPQLTATGVTGDVVLGLDADEDGDNDPNPFDLEGSVYDGCSPFTNAADLAGKVVMVNRGVCGFEVKARNIDAAGGIAAIIANRDPAPITMSGDADPDPSIPSVSIGSDDRNAIAGVIEGSGETVNVTMKDAGGERVDSYRWLIGEDATAFGSAIRDMWTPTCMSDPGKVSDAEYFCGTDDGGGVHSNSGVSNHAYSLLVDGGSYNGVDVTGIGLDKAAAIYFKAMTDYQTPTTDFEDHANALDMACTALLGTEVTELTVAEDASPGVAGTIQASDCAQVGAASDAVEFRAPPTQCNYQPMFDQNPPELCGPGTISRPVFSEDFEHALVGWTRASEVVYPGAKGEPWARTSELPKAGTHGSAAYGAAPDRGQCDGSSEDFSSRDSFISPVISIPKGKAVARKLAFDHYVATELGFDGGNVKYRISRGKWRVIPASAYTFNAPGQLATAAAGSTNPLAGQPGFTGTDGGEVTGSWGTSQVDLSALKVKAGDRIQVRFDIGRDGCGGIDGWYVDNVTVTVCETAAGARRAGTAAGREN
jgi:Zn-dependent metalloprotease